MAEQGQLLPVSPGEMLQIKRLERGLTLRHVAEQLKIRESALQAIETGQATDLSPVYITGYIRAYAKFLDVDLPNEMRIGDMLIGGSGDSAEPELQSVFTAKTPPRPTDRWLKATSYVVASVLIAALAWQFTHEAVRFSQGESRESVVEQSSADTTFVAESASTVRSEARNSHINASIASMELLSEGRQAAGEKAWAAIVAPVQPDAELAPGHNRLEITSSADTWVEILDASDSHLEMDLIRGGVQREYHGKSPFRILIGRASSVELTLDGDPVDLAPHTRGNVARLTLRAEMVADAQNPQQDSPVDKQQ